MSCKKRYATDFYFIFLVYAQSEFFDIQAYHRDLLEQLSPPATPVAPIIRYPPAFPSNNPIVKSSVKKSNRRRGDKKSGQKRHRKVVAGSRDNNPF